MTYKYFNEMTDPLMVGLTEELMLKLDSAHEISNRIAPTIYRITSGKRTAEGNSVLKGAVSDSSHLTGKGCDLHIEDAFNLFRLKVGLYGAGFKRVGTYYKVDPKDAKNLIPIHLHVDIDETKVQEIEFTKIEQN